MTDITLTAAVRQSLLSLQNTTGLIERTQNRMSTGLRVSFPTDDPVSFFQAKGLVDRATDFKEKKNSIDQGISSVGAALEGINGVESIVNQMKGIVQSLKTADASQTESLIVQFNGLRNQIGALTADTTYQGTNLINGTGQTLSVEFSDQAGSGVTIHSVDSTAMGLGIGRMYAADTFATTGTILAFDVPAMGEFTATAGGSMTITYGGAENRTLAPDDYFIFADIASGHGLSLRLTGATTLSVGEAYTFSFATQQAAGAEGSSTTFVADPFLGTTAHSIIMNVPEGASYVSAGNAQQAAVILSQLDHAKSELRTSASALGANVALLKSRLDFTTAYTNVLEGGSGKLTLADINEEGANLLALQTRQQLGINALSMAGKQEQSVMSLFG